MHSIVSLSYCPPHAPLIPLRPNTVVTLTRYYDDMERKESLETFIQQLETQS